MKNVQIKNKEVKILQQKELAYLRVWAIKSEIIVQTYSYYNKHLVWVDN